MCGNDLYMETGDSIRPFMCSGCSCFAASIDIEEPFLENEDKYDWKK